jgi:hypothetical protein
MIMAAPSEDILHHGNGEDLSFEAEIFVLISSGESLPWLSAMSGLMIEITCIAFFSRPIEGSSSRLAAVCIRQVQVGPRRQLIRALRRKRQARTIKNTDQYPPFQKANRSKNRAAITKPAHNLSLLVLMPMTIDWISLK